MSGASPGWRFIEDSVVMRSLRCDVCNTYPDTLVLSYRPEGLHLETITRTIRALELVTSNDGICVFGAATRDLLFEGGLAQNSIDRIGIDVYTFSLEMMEAVRAVSADHSKEIECAGCGRRSPVFASAKDVDWIQLEHTPNAHIVRSEEFFGRAYLRCPKIYLADAMVQRMSLARDSWDLLC